MFRYGRQSNVEALLGEVETVFPSRGAFHLDYMLFGAASGCMGFDREAFALMLDQVCTIIYTASVDYRIVFDYCRYTVALDIVNILSEFLRITSNAFATLASRWVLTERRLLPCSTGYLYFWKPSCWRYCCVMC